MIHCNLSKRMHLYGTPNFTVASKGIPFFLPQTTFRVAQNFPEGCTWTDFGRGRAIKASKHTRSLPTLRKSIPDLIRIFRKCITLILCQWSEKYTRPCIYTKNLANWYSSLYQIVKILSIPFPTARPWTPKKVAHPPAPGQILWWALKNLLSDTHLIMDLPGLNFLFAFPSDLSLLKKHTNSIIINVNIAATVVPIPRIM